MHVELLAVTKNPEALITRAGRVCYRSESESDQGLFIRKRIEQGHESIVEHASASFLIEGISRACSHQLVRHRLCSFSQESQRYTCSDRLPFVIPKSIDQNDETFYLLRHVVDEARRAYELMIDLGIPKEDARFVLPSAVHTRLVITANFRELLHIFRLRISNAAQWEIREVCQAMLDLVYEHAPNVFAEFK